QTTSGNLVKQFSEKCHYQSVEYFEEEMPVGKVWKKRQSSGCDISTGSSNQWLETTSTTAPESMCSGEHNTHKQAKANNHVAEQNGNQQTTAVCDNDNSYRMPNMEQWLALRVQGGARSWPKLPSCFNNMHS
ncbi:hypothetical protein LSH36_356g06044, partial [Paralvinella palmiformis]